jgi:hypothetical protein
MFRQPTLAACTALGLGLAATGCSGEGGGLGPRVASVPPPPVVVVNPPVSDPAPVPIPPPATGPQYDQNNVQMTVKATVATANDRVRVIAVNTPSTLNKNWSGVSIVSNGADGYIVDINGFGGPNFKPADKDTSTGGPAAVYRTPVDVRYADILEIVSAPPAVELTYTSLANLSSLELLNATTADAVISFLALGDRTPVSQMPVTGTARFTGIADGLWVDGNSSYRLYGSPVSLTADFGAGTVTSRLELRGYGNAFGEFWKAPTTTLGSFTATGKIGAGQSSFNGNIAAVNGYAGDFSGNFIGPAAGEFGFGFRLNGNASQAVIGVAVGKQN